MEQKPMIMSASNIEFATNRSNRSIKEVIEKSNNFQNDPDKIERLMVHLCKACFYWGGFIGGSAITRRDCMRCHKPQIYPSTATDVLCLECSKISKLCKHCGADIELKNRRKFPKPLEKTENTAPISEG